jgi:hypothetical protein
MGSFWATLPDAPILVFGNQKAGTTVMAALLAEMTQRSVTLDLRREVGRPTCQHVRSGKMSMAAFVRRNKRDFCSEIIKEPNFVVLFDQLTEFFPRSKMVFLVRDPRDNIRSVLNRLGFAGNLDRLDGPYKGINAAGWNLYLDGSWLGLSGANYIDILAARWNLAADVYLANPDRMVLGRYEDFLRDKAGEIARLAERLELPRRQDVAAMVDIQYQPRGDRGVGWMDFFGANNLARIERLCRSRMRQFGYEPSPRATP